jgi:acetaldehyde dehydrogenase
MTRDRLPVAILGSGNIGTDLIFKVLRNPHLDLRMVAGIDAASSGLAKARELGIETSSTGVDGILERSDIRLVFDATSARAHKGHAPLLEKAGIVAIDLTPAKVGPSIVPCVNMSRQFSVPNVNLISCAAQATIPIVYAISRRVPISYAEIVATVSSQSAGPGTRQNIDEFTHTTTKALIDLGGARRAKAIVVLNPADPPIIMRNAVYAVPDGDFDEEEVRVSIAEIVSEVQSYVPGYRLTVEPFMNGDHFVAAVEVEGAGDFLPAYSGNLDIINAAAVSIAERYASSLLGEAEQAAFRQ